MEKLDCIAVTGGIGSGKSTVLNLFKTNGFKIINMDSLAHELLKSSSPYFLAYATDIDAHFNTSYRFKNEISRNELRHVVNSTPQGFEILADVAKPYLIKLMEDEYKLNQLNHSSIVFEVPLLVEKQLDSYFKYIVAITCDISIRKMRIKKRDPHLSDEEIDHRIAIQSSDQEKIAVAHYVIDNSGTEFELNSKFKKFLSELSIPSSILHKSMYSL